MRSRILPRTATFVLIAAALATASTSVSAQPKAKLKHHALATHFANEAPPLTVNRRSFLDPGPVVPVGSMSNYVTITTIFNRTEDQTFKRSLFGNEALPAPLEIPLRSQPLVVF